VLLSLNLLAGCATDLRSIGAIVDDTTVELKASGILSGEPAYKDKVHVDVTSVNGIVLLTGETATTELRDAILAEIRAIPSIRRIVNEIRIAPPSSFADRSHDAWLTSEVKGRLVVLKDLHASRVKVVTDNNSVFLMGLVTQQEADLAADAASRVGGVTRVVKLFEFVD
jgi:osmotically-inducible protein OsmY